MSPVAAPPRQRPAAGKDYGYGNARIRGMRARLLGKPFFESLMGMTDLNGMIQALANTEYGPDLEETLIHGRTAAAIDDALRRNVVRVYRKVLGFINDEAVQLATTVLGRWDVYNLKTVLRGKHMHLLAEEISDGFLPVGQLSSVELEGLSALADVKAVVDTVATWELPIKDAMREGYLAFMRSGELADVELALDTYYAQWAAGRLSRRGVNAALARRILGMQVDIVNLRTAFRMLKADIEGVDPGKYYLSGGLAVSEDLFRELAAMSDVDEVLDRLRATPYGKALEDSAVAYIEEGSLAVFERTLEDYLMRRVVGAGTGDPLGLGVVVSYLWAKHNEATNLRIVVKGVSVGMPVERIRKGLILV